MNIRLLHDRQQEALPSSNRRLVLAFAALAGCWVLVGIGRVTLPAPGLRAQYFATPDWTGRPSRLEVDSDVTTGEISRAWRYKLPEVFSVQWTGWLFITRPGDYTFSVTSDDGSLLDVDHQVVLDTSHQLGTSTGVGRIHL